MHNVVFVGNCQIESMITVYRRFISDSCHKNVKYIKSYASLDGAGREALDEADLIVEQVQDFAAKSGVADLGPQARRVRVPVVHGGFLWPFAGQPHPANPAPAWFRATGAYGAEMGDAFLNRMLRRGVAADAAVAEYLALDINAAMPLDRLYEVGMEKQRARDAATGISIAPLIEAHFRTEALFLTPYHPNLRLMLELCAQVFAAMGARAADIALMRRGLRATPVPKDELPVHPGVARHFGLAWADGARRYRFLNEGAFTFAEYATRYMHCTWNAALEEGLAVARGPDADAAEALLRQGLAVSPDSTAGLRALSNVLERQQRHDEALALARQAVALDPEDGSLRVALGLHLRRAGQRPAAERELRLAAALDPFEANFAALLTQFLAQDGAYAEARAVAQHGLVCAPQAAGLQFQMGQVEEQAGYGDAAIEAYRAAVTLGGDETQAAAMLARLEARKAQAAEAGVAPLPERLQPSEGAETARDPLSLAWRAVAAKPGSVDARCRLAMLLYKRGEWAAAEVELRAALAIEPDSAHIRNELGFVLGEAGRLDEAIAERRRSVELQPSNPLRRLQMAHTLVKAADWDGATQAVREAIALAPGRAQFHGELARLLLRGDRAAEALAAAREATRLDAEEPIFRIIAAEASLALGDLATAGSALDEARARGGNAARLLLLAEQIKTAQLGGADLEPDEPHGGEPLPAPPVMEARELVMQFESLGGTGHGCEFGIFQRMSGAEPLGLLRWADLSVEYLVAALESQFEGVGKPEETIVFQPADSDEWWTRDRRYWMAMRTFVKASDVPYDKMVATACARLQFLQRKLMEDLSEGRKIFVYKNMFRDLNREELSRLYKAVRMYGDTTLLYLRYADANHPDGTVRRVRKGLLVGYVDHFAFSRDNKPLGPIDKTLMGICREALRWHRPAPQPQAEPAADAV